MKKLGRFLSVVFFALTLLSASAVHADDIPAKPEMRANWDFSEMGQIPVLSGGRMKPLDSLAREFTLTVTGKRVFKGWDPIELMLSWLAFPKAWDREEFINITRRDVKRQLGLDENRSYFSPEELFTKSYLADYAGKMGPGGLTNEQSTPISKTSRTDPRNAEMKRVVERVSIYRAIVTGEAWTIVPATAPNPWFSIAMPDHATSGVQGLPGGKIRENFMKVLASYFRGDQDGFTYAVSDLKSSVIEGVGPAWDQSTAKKVGLESWFNRVHPFRLAWIIYFLAFLVWILARLFHPSNVLDDAKSPGMKKWVSVALPLTLIAFLVHIGGMAVRCYIAGRPPVTNMYESIVWVSFGTVLFALILWVIQKNTLLFTVATALGTIGLIVSDAAPVMIDSSIQPLVPVLRSNYWLTIHVMTITLSYAAFALTLGIGNVALWQFIKKRDHTEDGKKKITMLNLLSYRAMQFGVALLAAGTILGGIWADFSWGRFWGWDPKEVWALIALLGYTTVIHARFTGWMKPFGFAAWTVVSFTLVLMAWYGVNFVLGVGLHSYGFSSGGQGSVAFFVVLQMAYVALAAIVHKRVTLQHS